MRLAEIKEVKNLFRRRRTSFNAGKVVLSGKVGGTTAKGPQVGEFSGLGKVTSHPQVNVVALHAEFFQKLQPEIPFLTHEPVDTVINSQDAARAAVPYVVESNLLNGETIFKARLFEGGREGS